MKTNLEQKAMDMAVEVVNKMDFGAKTWLWSVTVEEYKTKFYVMLCNGEIK